MDLYKLLSSYSKVETLISLAAFILAAILSYLAFVYSSKYKQVGNILDKANTQSKADLAISLLNAFPNYKIPDLNNKQGFEVVKIQLEQRSKEFKSKINIIKLGIILFFLIICILFISKYLQYPKNKSTNSTTGSQSPIVNGDSATIIFKNENK